MDHERALKQYLHEAKVYELIEKLQKQSYDVVRNYTEGEFQFDIYATHPSDKKRYIEVKSGTLSKLEQHQVARMAEYVKTLPDAKFELVVANPPRRKIIEIDGIESELFQYLSNNTPEELLSLSPCTIVDNVCDVEIDEVYITEENIRVIGTGTVEVIFDLGEGDGAYNSYPFKFNVTLDEGRNIVDNDGYILIDTASFYE